ncbi:hypothetical protein [Microcoleus sp. FACHB-672]|nr:hypothetical protein [Microcoleus sp. FACHB-672]
MDHQQVLKQAVALIKRDEVARNVTTYQGDLAGASLTATKDYLSSDTAI